MQLTDIERVICYASHKLEESSTTLEKEGFPNEDVKYQLQAAKACIARAISQYENMRSELEELRKKVKQNG